MVTQRPPAVGPTDEDEEWVPALRRSGGTPRPAPGRWAPGWPGPVTLPPAWESPFFHGSPTGWGPPPPGPAAADGPGLTLPREALRPALVGLLLGLLASLAGGVVGFLLAPDAIAVATLCSAGALWVVLLATCRWVSRRYGTGRVWTDLGVRGRRVDAAVGLGLSVAARIVIGIVAVLLSALSPRLVGSNGQVITDALGDTTSLVVVGLVTAVGAPFFEELFFRGLLLGALRARLPTAAAVAVQAAVFALCHANPALGLGNIGLVIQIGLLGGVLGTTTVVARRLGPGMWTHGLFNLGSVLLVLLVTRS